MNTDVAQALPHATRTAEDLARAFAALPGSQRFTRAQRESVHRVAYAALASGDFERAHRSYQWLVFYGGHDGRGWRGLAASTHALGRHAEALMHWTMVALLEPGAADATLYAGRCQAQLGQFDEACRSFERVARAPGADAALRAQAAQLLALLQRRAA